MKRFAALLLTLCLSLPLCLGAAAPARADGIDIKVKGQWDFSFGWVGNNHFIHAANRSRPGAPRQKDGRAPSDDSFQASQRVRTQINFITSEYLQAVLMFEIGSLDWGSNQSDTSGRRAARGTGGALDSDGVNIETKRAYLDWVIPYTEISVRMGIQGLKLPSTPMGSPVFDADVAGIVVSSPVTDWLSATAFWIRPFDAYQNDNDTPNKLDQGVGWPGSGMADETDVFGILLPMSFADWGLNFTPWFMYGFVGPASGFYDYLYNNNTDQEPTVMVQGGRTAVWWVGGHLEFTLFDPLTFNLEAIYGHLRRTALDGFGDYVIPPWGSRWYYTQHQSNAIGTGGWYVGATLDYKLDFMTPGIFGWWASGDRTDSWHTGKQGRLPVLGNDGGSFSPTSFGSAGYYGISQRDDGGLVTGTGTGTWGIGIQLADISFIEDLKHTLRFAYYKGTNDSKLVEDGGGYFTTPLQSNAYYFQYTADGLYLTDKDSVLEINFDHQYTIYENLTVVLELGWLRLNTDKITWQRHMNYPESLEGEFNGSDDAWKAQISFRYSF